MAWTIISVSSYVMGFIFRHNKAQITTNRCDCLLAAGESIFSTKPLATSVLPITYVPGLAKPSSYQIKCNQNKRNNLFTEAMKNVKDINDESLMMVLWQYPHLWKT